MNHCISLLQDERLAFIVGSGGHESRGYRGPGSTLAGWQGRRHWVSMAGASLAALPGGAPALHGIEDLMVDDGAIGAAQGHLHGLCPRRGAAGALVLHILRFDGVQCFAGTFTLKWDREEQSTVMVEKPGVHRT